MRINGNHISEQKIQSSVAPGTDTQHQTLTRRLVNIGSKVWDSFAALGGGSTSHLTAQSPGVGDDALQRGGHATAATRTLEESVGINSERPAVPNRLFPRKPLVTKAAPNTANAAGIDSPQGEPQRLNKLFPDWLYRGGSAPPTLTGSSPSAPSADKTYSYNGARDADPFRKNLLFGQFVELAWDSGLSVPVPPSPGIGNAASQRELHKTAATGALAEFVENREGAAHAAPNRLFPHKALVPKAALNAANVAGIDNPLVAPQRLNKLFPDWQYHGGTAGPSPIDSVPPAPSVGRTHDFNGTRNADQLRKNLLFGQFVEQAQDGGLSVPVPRSLGTGNTAPPRGRHPTPTAGALAESIGSQERAAYAAPNRLFPHKELLAKTAPLDSPVSPVLNHDVTQDAARRHEKVSRLFREYTTPTPASHALSEGSMGQDGKAYSAEKSVSPPMRAGAAQTEHGAPPNKLFPSTNSQQLGR
ncbi:hypothetical protein LMG19083_04679 [Ralstonia psammae]|uniref:Type III effector protein n=1 Tax=Ralstonia psammae TaxID=3058598 RepID=A0ABN9JDP2_9RALS|nr:hypothetical protein LMG19083_04679 [Ralstonia sp. LMG 19083]